MRPVLLFQLFLFLAAPTIVLGSAAWPGEQAGSTTLCDWPFDSISGKGAFAPSGGGGRIVSDATAPVSPFGVWRNTRNTTVNDAGLMAYNLPGAYQNEVFFGYAFRASNPHYGWFGWYQKLSLINDAVPHIYLKMQEIDEANGTFLIAGGPEKVIAAKDWENAHIAPDGYLWANVKNEVYRVGQWYKIEIYCKRSTTSSSRDGIFRWWVNGTLAGNYTTMNFAAPLKKVILSNIWDSVYPDLPYEEYVQYDHMYVSLPPGVMQPLTISTDTLPTGNTTTKYPTTTLAAKGGMPPYTWSLESGTLPAGMNFYPATGFLSGTPTERGTKSLVFKVTDAFGATATKAVSLVISGQSAISAVRTQSQTNDMSLETRAATNRVRFDLQFQNEGKFLIGVFDLHGRNVWSYSAATVKGSSAQVVWDHGNKLSKGVYLVRAEQNGKTMSMTSCYVW